MSTLPQTIDSYIGRHALMSHDGFYVVALSGGADSVALLRVLAALNYKVAAAHCNFMLRGAESTRDENFCVSLCARMGIALHRVHFDTRLYARLHKVSIEMAARELRYRYFEQLRQDLGADAVCVAHHRDDQVETVLLNLVRGTGVTGLRGMQPCHDHIVRPMLCVSRDEITDYLWGIGQDFVTDSTNLETDAMRNKLRIDIIPRLAEINPAVSENIFRMTENIGEAARVIDHAVATAVHRAMTAQGGYDLSVIAAEPSPLTVLWTIVSRHGFNRAQALEMLAHEGGTAEWRSDAHVAVIDRARLYIYGRKAWEHALPTLRVPEEGTYVYAMTAPGDDDGSAGTHDMRLRFSIVDVDAHFEIGTSADVATLDADVVTFPLTIRPIREGDRFVPFGMRGTKLVSDFLADRKVPPAVRRHQTVLCSADGSIVWVVGLRPDDRAAIRRGHTRRALVVEKW